MTRSSPISPARVKKKKKKKRLTRSLWQKHVFGAVMDSAERTGTPTGWGGEVTEGSGGGEGCMQQFARQMGPFCWNVKPALSWHAIINLSVVCVCALHVRARHAWRGNWWHLNRKYPLPFSSIDVTVTVRASISSHRNAGWHMPYNGNTLYRLGTNTHSQEHTSI